ncbi:MAG: WXG100 family type VII secretion target [Butyrivibrio sp.]|nr:WXG100 family type VII secretion target [Butyrivibrio sp.]
MDSIRVRPEVLKNTATKVDNKAEEYFNHYKALLEWTREFTKNEFQGEDAEEFYSHVEGFRNDFDKMKELMNKYAQYLRDTAERYIQIEEEVKSQIASTQN